VGFFDKMKGTAQQAMSPGAQSSERDKIMKISKTGVEGRATVNSMNEVGTSFGGGHDMEFELTVKGANGGADYNVSLKQNMHDATLTGITTGGDVIVKIDPDDPQSLLVWGPAT
jgi:hypothetical protein